MTGRAARRHRAFLAIPLFTRLQRCFGAAPTTQVLREHIVRNRRGRLNVTLANGSIRVIGDYPRLTAHAGVSQLERTGIDRREVCCVARYCGELCVLHCGLVRRVLLGAGVPWRRRDASGSVSIRRARRHSRPMKKLEAAAQPQPPPATRRGPLGRLKLNKYRLGVRLAAVLGTGVADADLRRHDGLLHRRISRSACHPEHGDTRRSSAFWPATVRCSRARCARTSTCRSINCRNSFLPRWLQRRTGDSSTITASIPSA